MKILLGLGDMVLQASAHAVFLQASCGRAVDDLAGCRRFNFHPGYGRLDLSVSSVSHSLQYGKIGLVTASIASCTDACSHCTATA